MSDGIGSVIYGYDQLSRLTSESRDLSELGQSFTLSYSYNLAGQMTSITEPSQFGSTVIYTYNEAGKVSDVTGTGGGASQYATGLQYRAWGGLKHLNYGNSLTLDLSYNNRLQANHHDLKTSTGSRVMGQDYQYDAAGQITSSTDLTNSNLNRNYTYDYVGRITLGDTANGSLTGPYKQTYGYDVWGNFTNRTWRTFQQTPFGTFPQTNSTTTNYLNNRNTASGWNYDADGRLISGAENGVTFTYGYDAAGRMASATQPGKTTNQSFDGNGQRAKWIENGVVTYHLKSTALGGQTITELNQFGQKVRGYVYAGGQEVAKQEGGQVLWSHRDISGVSTRLTSSSGTVTSKVETDPLGTQVADTSNYNYNGGGNGYGFNPNGFYGDPTMPNMGCSADGLPADCNWVQRMINSGAAVQCPPGGCGPRAGLNQATGNTELFPFNANAAAVGIGTFGVGLGFLPTGVNFVGNGFTVAAGRGAVFSGMGTSVDAPTGATSQFYSLNQIEILVPWHSPPQNSQESWAQRLKSYIPRKMDDQQLRNFVKGYNLALQSLDEPNCLRAISELGGDLMFRAKSALEKIRNEQRFLYAPRVAGGYIAVTMFTGKKPPIIVSDKFFGGVPGDSNRDTEQLDYAQTLAFNILHELVHALTGKDHGPWETTEGRAEGKRWNDRILDDCILKK